jgi:hypothetical protein
MKIEAKVPDPGDARATAQYIEAMAKDLKGLATGAGLSFLAYLLAMVEADAAATVRRGATKVE